MWDKSEKIIGVRPAGIHVKTRQELLISLCRLLSACCCWWYWCWWWLQRLDAAQSELLLVLMFQLRPKDFRDPRVLEDKHRTKRYLLSLDYSKEWSLGWSCVWVPSFNKHYNDGAVIASHCARHTEHSDGQNRHTLCSYAHHSHECPS